MTRFQNDGYIYYKDMHGHQLIDINKRIIAEFKGYHSLYIHYAFKLQFGKLLLKKFLLVNNSSIH